uniref:Uncharacterized protein n=1 Tax=Spermophilus dauricus TaxID=99837 RepID=A0A8C9PWG2_SPEDA
MMSKPTISMWTFNGNGKLGNNFYKETEGSIAGAHEKCWAQKAESSSQTNTKTNCPEHDALAKKIQHHPDRHKTLKELEALRKESAHLSQTQESTGDKQELKQKQPHVLLIPSTPFSKPWKMTKSSKTEAQETNMDRLIPIPKGTDRAW